jgi:hypothetical protein
MFDKGEAFVKFQNRIREFEKTEKLDVGLKILLYRAAVKIFFLGLSYASYWQRGRGGKESLDIDDGS